MTATSTINALKQAVGEGPALQILRLSGGAASAATINSLKQAVGEGPALDILRATGSTASAATVNSLKQAVGEGPALEILRGMRVAVLQHAISNGGANSATVGPVDTTGANLIVLSVTGNIGVVDTAPTDSKNNTWTSILSASGAVMNQLWYCVNPTTDAAHTFSIALASGFMTIGVLAASGVNTVTVPTSAGNDESPGDGSIQPGSVTPTLNGSLIVCGLCMGDGDTAAINSGFTALTKNLSGGVNYGAGWAYLLQTTAAAVNPTWTFSNAGTGSDTVIAVFSP